MGYFGLVPRQWSSGGKTILFSLPKRGDSYLRKLLIHGAWSLSVTKVLQSAQCTFKLKWLLVDQYKLKNVAVVAMTNQNVRIAWALLFYDEAFKHDYASGAAYQSRIDIRKSSLVSQGI